MLDESSLIQSQVSSGLQTTNPQSVAPSNLQPQQNDLQNSGGGVLGTSTILEQSNTSSVAVDNQAVSAELSELQSNQSMPSSGIQSAVAGHEIYVIGFTLLLIAGLIYVLVKQIMRDRTSKI